MRNIKFRPKRISISKSDDVIELVFERNGNSSALVVRNTGWDKIFRKVFKDHEDARSYDITADYECYITENLTAFRVCGVLGKGSHRFSGPKFRLDKIIDENNKIWIL